MKTKMTLRDFVESCVTPNTLCRLWLPYEGEEKHISRTVALGEVHEGEPRQVFMEWELLKGRVPQSKYLDCQLEGVSDIFVDDFYREAVNICVIPNNVKEELYKKENKDVPCKGGCVRYV